jgi:hypothetical protein
MPTSCAGVPRMCRPPGSGFVVWWVAWPLVNLTPRRGWPHTIAAVGFTCRKPDRPQVTENINYLPIESEGDLGMIGILNDLLVFSCFAALITGIVIGVASVLI